MGLLDQVIGAVEGQSDQHKNVAVSVFEMLGGSQAAPGGTAAAAGGGLTGLVEQMTANGLGHIVQSWIGKGANLPISADQIKAVLGSEALQGLAAKAGVHVDTLAPILAQLLPGIVDKMTPDGQLPATPAPTSSGAS